MRYRPRWQAWRQRHRRSHLGGLLGPAIAGPLARLAKIGLLASLISAGGCMHATAPRIHPWQREYLSKRAMRFDADPLEMRFRQHMWGSREGSDLGFGQPGGGCGCN